MLDVIFRTFANADKLYVAARSTETGMFCAREFGDVICNTASSVISLCRHKFKIATSKSQHRIAGTILLTTLCALI